MYEPEINKSNVHHLHRGKPSAPPDIDVMGVLLRELSETRPLDRCERMPDTEEGRILCATPSGRAQHAEGKGNIQIGAQEGVTQTARGNHNVQIADFQLIVQMGLTGRAPSPATLREIALRVWHVVMVILLVIAILY